MKLSIITVGLCALFAVRASCEGRATVFQHEEGLLSFSAPDPRSAHVSFVDRRTPCTSWTSSKKPNMAIVNTPYKAVLSTCPMQCSKQCRNDPQCSAFTYGPSNEGDLACWFYAIKNTSHIKWKPSTVYASGYLTCNAPQAAAVSAETARPRPAEARPPNSGIEISVSKATEAAGKRDSIRATSAEVSMAK